LDKKEMSINRRTLLLGTLNAGLGLATGGCDGLTSPIRPICGNDPSLSDPSTPLTIDVHAHVFNGSDLQVDGFLSDVMRIPGVGPILQGIAWSEAPTAEQELAELARISDALRRCDRSALEAEITRNSQRQYEIAVEQLKRSANETRNLKSLDQPQATSEFISQIESLPPDFRTYKRARNANKFLRNRVNMKVTGALDFILRAFNFRYVNVFDYLAEYSSSKKRKVDLIVAHLVDYDWPIARGNETQTSIPDQITVMSKISALTLGRVHCFAPFDPFKQIAFDMGRAPYSPFDLVQDAVLNQGFIGVKLYPPMGFLPYGNNAEPTSFWTGGKLPPELLTSDLGVRLDKALGQLYAWCSANEVPIMAHTAPSNSPTTHVRTFTSPDAWKVTLQCFPKLRINFGHFGETDEVKSGIERALKFSELMDAGPGSFTYADSAYFADVVTRPNALLPRIRELLRRTSKKGDAALGQRLMYGTDWEMIIIEGRETNDYLVNFERLFSDLQKDGGSGAEGNLSNNFFGNNAAKYLGLHQRDVNRGRLVSFHDRNNNWKLPLFDKVDRS
jgi:predicted TIM-barrel fold metal-dependent hydrolase